MTNDVDTLATAIYATTDDMLKEHPDLAPWRPPVGITPRLSDAELVTLATMQAILGYTSEAKWLRHARAHLRHLFPYLPQPRLQQAAAQGRRSDAKRQPDPGHHHLGVERRRSWTPPRWNAAAPARPSNAPNWQAGPNTATAPATAASSGGLRLHLVCTLQGLPIAFALTGAKADERETLLDLLAAGCELLRERPRQTLIGDKNYFGRGFERELSEHGVQLLRPARKGERERPGAALFKPLRQVIESINETFKGQLDLERHRGRTPGGVIARVMQRILALTVEIWHNDATGQTVLRSLIAYDH